MGTLIEHIDTLLEAAPMLKFKGLPKVTTRPDQEVV